MRVAKNIAALAKTQTRNRKFARRRSAEIAACSTFCSFRLMKSKKLIRKSGEDDALNEEKRRLNNVEKLSALSDEAYLLLYENEESTVSTLEKAARKITELAEYESSFNEYDEGLQTAQAVLEDLAFAVRDFRGSSGIFAGTSGRNRKSSGGNLAPETQIRRRD